VGKVLKACGCLPFRAGCAYLAALSTMLPVTSLAQATGGCAPESRCLSVNENGTIVPGPGPSVAQCTGMFPDFITPTSVLPSGYSGPWFVLSQKYPQSVPPDDAPWLKIDFMNGTVGANAYLNALRDYAFEGMLDSDFRAQDNKIRPWFHMPLMNFGANRREPSHGLTEERPVNGPELGVRPGVTIRNFAIGFYNAAGGVTIGEVWKSGTPDLQKARFLDGAMSFKILFSAAAANDFSDPGADPMSGAPQWDILTEKGVTAVRLLQMDVAAVDSRSPTGWVFGTFAFQKSATDASPWLRLRSVGLSWGNDNGYTPADQQAGKRLSETIISDQAPNYAANHLGWAGRTNGPVDNPISGCLSCHGTAEFPVAADLAPFKKSCDTDQNRMYWFRNFRGDVPFGAVDGQCNPMDVNPPPIALDFSLQMKVTVQSVLQFKDINPCSTHQAILKFTIPAAFQDAPRVQR